MMSVCSRIWGIKTRDIARPLAHVVAFTPMPFEIGISSAVPLMLTHLLLRTFCHTYALTLHTYALTHSRIHALTLTLTFTLTLTLTHSH